MKYDSWRPRSRPHTTFPDTREHGSSRPVKTSTQTLDRTHCGALRFAANRRGGNVILHHRHIRPVLIRDWSRPMDGVAATIWASASTSAPSTPAGIMITPRSVGLAKQLVAGADMNIE